MRGQLEPRFHVVPKEMDETVARLKLETLDIAIDERTAEQVAYDDYF
jgi:adenosylhomocysteinase